MDAGGLADGLDRPVPHRHGIQLKPGFFGRGNGVVQAVKQAPVPGITRRGPWCGLWRGGYATRLTL